MNSDADEQLLDQAVARGLRFLSRRARTVAEVRSKLEQSSTREEIAEAAILRISEMGYLDDQSYAVRFAEDRRHLDGWGNERIARRLSELGVERNFIECALDDSDRQSELARAIAILEKRLSEPAVTTPDFRKAMGLLVRRGYDSEIAADAVRVHANQYG